MLAVTCGTQRGVDIRDTAHLAKHANTALHKHIYQQQSLNTIRFHAYTTYACTTTNSADALYTNMYGSAL